MRRAGPRFPPRGIRLVALAGAARVAASVLALVLGAALVAAPVPSQAAGKVYTVEIKDMAFGPVPKTLHVGDAIEWVNADIFRHTATAKSGAFDVDLAPKARARTVFNRPFATGFYCRFHPGMTGTLTVAK
jgi:plastocyanin